MTHGPIKASEGDEMTEKWYISGCPVCGFAEHTPRPAKRCPNDGERLIRLEGRTAAWGRLTMAHRMVRDAIKSARRAAKTAPW